MKLSSSNIVLLFYFNLTIGLLILLFTVTGRGIHICSGGYTPNFFTETNIIYIFLVTVGFHLQNYHRLLELKYLLQKLQ